MTVTQRILNQDSELQLHNENEWGVTNSTFKSFNDAGVECEVGEFLYSMVRMLKPSRVLETGTHFGISASYIGMGLKDNHMYGDGESEKPRLDTFEYQPEVCKVASDRITRLALDDFVNCLCTDVTRFRPLWQYQMMFLDTEPASRFKELELFYNDLAPGGFVFIHDTPRNLCQGNVNTDWPDFPSWPFGDIPDIIKNLVREGGLRPFHFPSPRGLVGFYKRHPDDFNWS